MIEPHPLEALKSTLQARSEILYIALSGGIDSITLMTVAARERTAQTIAVHAVSAAVPQEATERCRKLADRFNWQLVEVDANEFGNSQYLANPVNRCYYCKSSLFDSINATFGGNGTIATGTNTDDLGDYRPGLKAASERNVWQPYVEAQVNKDTIRQIAVQYELGDLSQLPAQPCLSSRVETGIRINPADLGFIHRVERALEKHLGAGDIRCRIVNDGVVVQLPTDCIVFTDNFEFSTVESLVKKLCNADQRLFVKLEPYKMGSAFLRTEGRLFNV